MSGVTVLATSQGAAVEIWVTATLAVSFLALGIVGWIFWRAARRDRHAGR